MDEITDVTDNDPVGDAYAKGYAAGYKAKATATEREIVDQERLQQLIKYAKRKKQEAYNHGSPLEEMGKKWVAAWGTVIAYLEKATTHIEAPKP
ncbi:hypothetical protein [Fimbriiglobus ruber]|uniref:hypothetical protein n=1 Tax=Fimbriiglobus ruber TaxID=1908690 RepID=UPI001179A0EC|nr:hypothetical protein [Fimbriiglobus ruber]